MSDLFTAYERLETCKRTEVTDDNIAALAKHFGWIVDYGREMPALMQMRTSERVAIIVVGDWIDDRGSCWSPEPLTQGWSPEGTFAPVAAAVPAQETQR